MFVVELREASAALRSQEEVDAIIDGIQRAGLTPILRSMVHAAYRAASLSGNPSDFKRFLGEDRLYRTRRDLLPAPGDLFFTPDEAYVVRPSTSSLQVWSIRHHTKKGDAPRLCEIIASSALSSLDGRRLRGMDFTWRELPPLPRDPEFRSRPRREIKLQSKPAQYTEEEASQASILSSPSNREFLIRLAQVRGRARSIDAGSEMGAETPTTLLEAGLIEQEYLLVCRHDSHTICTLKDKGQLTSDPLGAARCTICGRPFSQELVEEIFALSQGGADLIAKSHWMTVWVTHLLIGAGIRPETILWNATSGDDEIDIIVDMYGARVFFELKDRDFGVGDAYPFLYRLERYGGSLGVVISTDSVAEEVKRLLRERQVGIRQLPVQIIEQGDAIPALLPSIVDDISSIPARRVVEEFAEPYGVNPLPLFQEWLTRASM